MVEISLVDKKVKNGHVDNRINIELDENRDNIGLDDNNDEIGLDDNMIDEQKYRKDNKFGHLCFRGNVLPEGGDERVRRVPRLHR